MNGVGIANPIHSRGDSLRSLDRLRNMLTRGTKIKGYSMPRASGKKGGGFYEPLFIELKADETWAPESFHTPSMLVGSSGVADVENGKILRISPGERVYLRSYVHFLVRALTDCEVVIASIPEEEGLPYE